MSPEDRSLFKESDDSWALTYNEYRQEDEGLREALCAVGNGYFVTRGASAQSTVNEVHYPGTYLAGGFNRLPTVIGGRTVENEDLVNLPNWLPLTFRINDGPAFDIDASTIMQYRQQLDLRQGVLSRVLVFKDDAGRETELAERRFVSMADKNVAILEVTLTPQNWSGHLTFVSALDGTVTNAGVPRYRGLASDHLEVVATSRPNSQTICLVAETSQSRIRIAEAALTRVEIGGEPVHFDAELTERRAFIGLKFPIEAQRGVPLKIEKTVVVCTSRERGISEPAYAALERLHNIGGFKDLLESHSEAWDAIWRRCAIDVGDNEHVAMLLHLHIFHLLQTVSLHTIDLDAGLPARGLHGEAYRGHIFWDELYVFPFLTSVFPEITRALLLYRYRRLAAAIRAARSEGFDGAMFPWQSGSDGREETQVLHLNPKSGRWLPDNSRLQRHVNVAIAYNVWRYYEMTGDTAFLATYGAEILLQISRFLTSLTSFDESRGRFVICGVMGPDEYHDAYPRSKKAGINNNAYTNIATSWVLQRALETLDQLPLLTCTELIRRLRVSDEELERWRDISQRLFVPFLSDGVISQFEGYDVLDEFDWEAYKAKYGDVARLDRILEAENDTPNKYKLSKQADVLMLFYLFPLDEVQELLTNLGYKTNEESLRRTFDFYATRTSHGSTLSRVVHARLKARTDPSASWSLFLEALESDLCDIQGGTTREGVHLGVMAGTVDLVRRGFAGVDIRDGAIVVDPQLPLQLDRVRYELLIGESWLGVELANGQITVSNREENNADIKLKIQGCEFVLCPGQSIGTSS